MTSTRARETLWQMLRVLAVAALVAVAPGAAPAQAPLGVLHIRVSLTDAAGEPTPVPNHALLISDNPATSAPRLVRTGPDGTADVKLRPGNYTVESDAPVAFGGKGYQWTEIVQVGGGDQALELTSGNAEVGLPPMSSPASSSSRVPIENDASFLLLQWKDSIVAIWTPVARVSGFLVDAAGLVVTSQRAIGGASAVEVQIAPAVKVAARVLVADRVRDIAVLWIDSATAASARPISLDCAAGVKPPFAEGQRVVAIGVPLRGQKDLQVGEVIRVLPRASIADFRLSRGGIGGPVFSTGGAVLGVTSIADEEDARRGNDVSIVPVDAACDVVRSAEKTVQTTARPVATRLPVEPLGPWPTAGPGASAPNRADSLSTYQMSSSDFDITFLTPLFLQQTKRSSQQATTRMGGRANGPAARLEALVSPTDFGDWSDYFADVPPVLVVRVTPKLAESFWTTVARGAAYTQGIGLPAIKRFKPGFSRLRALCGDRETVPIHPFILEQRLSETDAIREGLYVFDLQALGPHCSSVTLELYSEKEPGKRDTRAVDPKILERIRQDVAP